MSPASSLLLVLVLCLVPVLIIPAVVWLHDARLAILRYADEHAEAVRAEHEAYYGSKS